MNALLAHSLDDWITRGWRVGGTSSYVIETVSRGMTISVHKVLIETKVLGTAPLAKLHP